MVDLEHYLIVSGALFVVGIFGLIMNRKTIFSVLISVELMLFAVTLMLLAFASFGEDRTGQGLAVFVLLISAFQMALGFALTLSFFRARGSFNTDDADQVKG